MSIELVVGRKVKPKKALHTTASGTSCGIIVGSNAEGTVKERARRIDEEILGALGGTK